MSVYSCLVFIASVLLTLVPGMAHAQEKVVMQVFLNTVDKGEHFLVVTGEGVLLLSAQELREMGIASLPRGAEVMIKGEEYIPLHSLYPGVKFEADENEAVLTMSADPKVLRKTEMDLAYARPVKAEYSERASGFVNYSLAYSNGGGYESLSLPWEAGLSVAGYLLFSNFAYSKTGVDEDLVRLTTSLTKDDVDSQRRLILGDFSTSSGVLGGSQAFGGISVSKNFSLTPYFIKTSGLDVSGVLKTPSDVDVYVNGNLVKSERLSPGEFNLMNVPNAAGSGDATVVIRDAYGKEERIAMPFYLSSALLRRGVAEYSYNLGFKREGFARESLGYGGLAFTGFHRLGLTRTLTAGARAEADGDIFNAGPDISFVLGRAGEFDASVAFSKANGSDGYAGAAAYSYVANGLSARASVRSFSRRYANLSLPSTTDRPKLEGTAVVGYSNRWLGSISASFAAADNHVGASRKRAALYYSKMIYGGVSLFVNASRTWADEITDDLFAGLNFTAGESVSGGVSHQENDGWASQAGYVQKNPPLGPGTGYRFMAERDRDSHGGYSFNGSAFVQHNGRYGTYSADYSSYAGAGRYTLNMSGALVFINRSAYMSRPVSDGFAVVKVGGLEGVKVSYSNQTSGVTDKRGELLVPELISYAENKLSIDDKDIPVNYSIRELSRNISIPYRGGALVRFDADRVRVFSGRLFLLEKGVKNPAEYAGVEISAGGGLVESATGSGGEFYLENLPVGPVPARVFAGDRECFFEMSIPEGVGESVDMGEVVCEMH